jgi:hypothetical protein
MGVTSWRGFQSAQQPPGLWLDVQEPSYVRVLEAATIFAAKLRAAADTVQIEMALDVWRAKQDAASGAGAA